MGMVNNTEKSDTPMHELQALAFAIQELALYLDTHREDREALGCTGLTRSCTIRVWRPM